MTLEFKILNKLLDKYERSKVSKGENKVNISISLDISDEVFNGHRNYDGNILETTLLRIERDGYAKIINSRNGQFQKIELNLNNNKLNQLYTYLKRVNPNDTIILLLGEFKNHLDDSQIIKSFSSAMIELLENKNLKKVMNYVTSVEEIRDIVKAINEMEKLEIDVPERVFCAKLFSDSKRFNDLRGKISKIIKEFSDEPFDEEDDVIALMGVIRNKTYAFIKGDLVIKINNQTINLNEYKEPLALSDNAIENLEVISSGASELYTIENLTSFEVFNKDNSIAIYLGGFHNKTKRELIIKINNAFKNISYYHYGDIDAGGFYILNHLRQKTGINFMPYKMGILELEMFKEHTKTLTANDRKRLEKMMLEEAFLEFKKVIEFMLINNQKLEQEAEVY